MSNADIIIQNLSFSFESGRSLFEHFSLHAKAGELSCIVGPNGSGKSTLMRIMRGEVRPCETIHMHVQLREVTTHVQAAHDIPSLLREHVLLVHQQFDRMLAPSFTALENLRLANMHQYPSLHALPHYRNITGLLGKQAMPLDIPVARLSGGQRQMLAILMILQRSPWVLLLDEPSAALDVQNTELVFNFLRDLARLMNIPVIVISHDQAIIERYADTIVRIANF